MNGNEIHDDTIGVVTRTNLNAEKQAAVNMKVEMI